MYIIFQVPNVVSDNNPCSSCVVAGNDGLFQLCNV
jgi:hypothetical protein